jgi:hypothetical protein
MLMVSLQQFFTDMLPHQKTATYIIVFKDISILRFYCSSISNFSQERRVLPDDDT